MHSENKKTVVFGASPNATRYSFLATQMLSEYDHEVVPLGWREGKIGQHAIIKNWPETVDDIDTITLYVNPHRQREFYSFFLSLNPKRIIFNPGTENPELEQMASEKGIEVVEACTLVMLRTGQY